MSLFVEPISLRLYFNTWFSIVVCEGVVYSLGFGVDEVFFEFIAKKSFYLSFLFISIIKIEVRKFCFFFSFSSSFLISVKKT